MSCIWIHNWITKYDFNTPETYLSFHWLNYQVPHLHLSYHLIYFLLLVHIILYHPQNKRKQKCVKVVTLRPDIAENKTKADDKRNSQSTRATLQAKKKYGLVTSNEDVKSMADEDNRTVLIVARHWAKLRVLNVCSFCVCAYVCANPVEGL